MCFLNGSNAAKKKEFRIRFFTGDMSMIFIHQDLGYGK